MPARPLVTHEFLYLLECPIPLQGSDLLTKFGVQITFAPRNHVSLILWSQSTVMMAVTMPREDEMCLYSSEREQTNPTSLLKCFLLSEQKKGPQFGQKPHTHHGGHEAKGHSFQREAISSVTGGMPGNLRPHPMPAWHQHFDCQSPLNTLLLPVKKPGGNYCLHNWDLRTINNTMITIHPVVPNPYTLLSLLPIYASWFTCLDLKDFLFCLHCHGPARPSLPLSGKTHTQTQLTWTRLLQGFKNSPTLFGEVLAVGLAAFPRENLNCTFLQYIDDLFLASQTRKDCWKATKALLALLSTIGYKMSWKKVPICRQEVISRGHWALGHERKQTICSIPRPVTKKCL